jgi:DNA-binding protein YbaB
MQEAQQQLSELVVSGEYGGGMVKIEMNGRHDVIKVKLKKYDKNLNYLPV